MVTSLPLTESNLVLTGYIEPNKPRIAQAIAQQLRMPFVDVEEEIRQRYGDDTETIRGLFGERHLKSLEAAIMDEVTLRRHTVIRVNGTILMHNEHYERLQPNGLIVCLVARLDAILQRLHLTMGARYHDPTERARQLGHLRREWAVRHKAGLYEIDATYLNDQQIIENVVELWQREAINRI